MLQENQRLWGELVCERVGERCRRVVERNAVCLAPCEGPFAGFDSKTHYCVTLAGSLGDHENSAHSGHREQPTPEHLAPGAPRSPQGNRRLRPPRSPFANSCNRFQDRRPLGSTRVQGASRKSLKRHDRARTATIVAKLLICWLKVRFLPGSPDFLVKTPSRSVGRPLGRTALRPLFEPVLLLQTRKHEDQPRLELDQQSPPPVVDGSCRLRPSLNAGLVFERR